MPKSVSFTSPAPDNKMFAKRLKHFQEDELKTLDGIEME